MADVTIRPAAADDSAAIARLIGQLDYEVSAYDVAKRLAAMQAEERLVLVAELDGAVVGCLSTSVMRVLHRPAPVGRISMMVVEEGGAIAVSVQSWCARPRRHCARRAAI